MNVSSASIELMYPPIELENQDVNSILSNQASFISGTRIPISKEHSFDLVFNKKENGHMLASSIEEFEELLRHHEVETYTKYTIYKTNGPFKEQGKDPVRKPRIHWGVLSKVSPELSTTPYLIVGTRYYVCHLGKCYYTAKLQKYCTTKIKGNKKRYNKVTDSKKVGCPANFKVQRLIVFPDNKLSCDTPTERARMGEHIKKNISSIKLDNKYIFKFPNIADHKNHMKQDVSAVKEPIDKRVIEKIKDLVYSGKNSVSVVGELLEEFVETQIMVTDKKRRRFFPSEVDIQRIIHKAKLCLRKSKNDQEKVESIKSTLGDSNEVYFRPSILDSPLVAEYQCSAGGPVVYTRRSGFSFVYQNTEMRRLYNLYGHNCILLDPTYKFCQFPFPFYFIAVQTNVNYQIVAMFITEFETKEAIIEALSIVADWNPTVVPKYAMTDNNSHDIKALESVFFEIKVYVAKYYCEASWEQSLLRKDISNTNRMEAFEKLRTIATSVTQEDTQKAINELKAWHQEPLLKEIFEKFWQKEIKKWAIVYRSSDLLFESNEAVDRLNEEFEYMSLSYLKNLTLSQMVVHLCFKFLPKTLLRYKTLNKSMLHRHSSNDFYIPSYLLQSPQWILDIIVSNTLSSDQSISHYDIESLSNDAYSLVSKKSNSKYNITFSPELKQVTCTCLFYLKRRVICKHAVIVGRFYPAWNLEKISVWLFDNPIFKYDNFFNNSISINYNSEVEEKFGNEDTANSQEKDILLKTSVVASVKATSFLKESCKENLRSLEAVVQTLSLHQLEKFHLGLKELCSKWPLSAKIDYVEAKEDKEDTLLHPLIKKISDFYINAEDKVEPTRSIKRMNKKRKKFRTSWKNQKRSKTINNEDLEMGVDAPFYDVEEHEPTFSAFSIKIEENQSDILKVEVNSQIVDERIEEDTDVIIHINNDDIVDTLDTNQDP